MVHSEVHDEREFVLDRSLNVQQRSTEEFKAIDRENLRNRCLLAEFDVGATNVGILVHIRRANVPYFADL